jgi:porphobilinogen synthase
MRDRAATLKNLGQASVAYAQAGADVIAPSGMVDGMVREIRDALDKSSFANTAICSYAVKYASSFYGPFREVADNAPMEGTDRKGYQMDAANRREALREAELDVSEGADLLLVKPAMSYLDIIRDVSELTRLPVGAYQVSGEYAMIKAAAERGWINEEGVFTESLLSMRRAGAQFILTYWAPRAAELLKEGKI